MPLILNLKSAGDISNIIQIWSKIFVTYFCFILYREYKIFTRGFCILKHFTNFGSYRNLYMITLRSSGVIVTDLSNINLTQY